MTDELSALLDALVDSTARLRMEIPAVPEVVADRTERAAKADLRAQGAEDPKQAEDHAEEARLHREQADALKASIAGHYKTLAEGMAVLPKLIAEALGDDAPTLGA